MQSHLPGTGQAATATAGPVVLLWHRHDGSPLHQVAPAATCPSLTVQESKLRSQQTSAHFARIPEMPGCFLQSPWFPARPAAQHLCPWREKAPPYARLWGRALWETQGVPSAPRAHPPELRD